VRSYRHDEVSVEGDADPFEQRDGRHDAARLQAGQRGLSHASPGSEFDLGQAEG
jgi:hypothetical protein